METDRIIRFNKRAKKCAQTCFFALSVFYKNRKKITGKLLNIYIILIDVQNSGWYNKAYRMTKSQFAVTVRDMIL